MSSLLEETLAAHGGAERFEAGREVVVGATSGGLAFASKGQRKAFRGVEGRVATSGQRTVFDPYPGPGMRGVFDAGTVRIETAEGETVDERPNARAAFGGLRHALWWDRLDILYFGGYALWTYVSLPFVLARPGYEVEELDGRRLRVTFPPSVETHSRTQTIHVDRDGLISRLDYTAEPIGRFARAANHVLENTRFDGLVTGTRRRVYPTRRNGKSLSRPLLVWIELAEPRLVG